MFYQDWFDHVKEKKFIGQENVSLIMILKNTGPALGLGLKPLILCLKLSINSKKKKVLKTIACQQESFALVVPLFFLLNCWPFTTRRKCSVHISYMVEFSHVQCQGNSC